MRPIWAWSPALLFALGAAMTMGLKPQSALDLRAPLADAVPASLNGAAGTEVALSDAEVRVAGVDAYVFRTYQHQEEAAARVPGGFSVYVGYYGAQTQGRTIHSPKNCMPGSGWEALESREARIATAAGTEVPVNRYVLQRGDERVLVLYWYQGRGRVQANEYRVKLDLLKDSALRRRSDEALVRIVVPVRESEAEAFEQAARIAGVLVPAVDEALPS